MNHANPPAQPGPWTSSRKFRWISSIDGSPEMLVEFQRAMAEYYSTRPEYYADVNFTEDNWQGNALHEFIAGSVRQFSPVLEVGCGRANILKHLPQIEPAYTGTDFSTALIERNRAEYPRARFESLQHPNRLPFPDGTFACVFSVFVLEHCVFPAKFLDESARVLKPGGTMLLLCPDMLGRSRMTSQQLGFGAGTGRQKLQAGRWLDALVTAWDTRVRMKVAAGWRRMLARRAPRFYINVAPLCFTQRFQPDFDAVYLTFRDEIVDYLAGRFEWSALPETIRSRCESEGLILLEGRRT